MAVDTKDNGVAPMKLDKYTLRQTNDLDIHASPPPEPELTETQKARLARQTQFKLAFQRLLDLQADIDGFSTAHHFFKPETKQRWVVSLASCIDGMRPFLPRDVREATGKDLSPD